ncbi:hypothetical protein KI387_018196 [Taxus chinensis]|uniref:Proteasome inhibitor PI31 subunit n=1 Tax=Taxus chinensis TaxID=29808 RepID=A0AA38LJN9_TAXCH|nr:hypothetical protein KI387_018196 [Taxus chinensis]
MADSVLAVIRASRPRFRNKHDKVAFAVHAAFLAAGYSLTATGSQAAAAASSGDEEVGIEGWNEMEDAYAFSYTKSDKGENKYVIVKCLVMGDMLTVDAAPINAKDNPEPLNFEMNVNEYTDDSASSNNYGEQYKNFSALVERINSTIISKLEDSPKKENASGSSKSSVTSSGGQGANESHPGLRVPAYQPDSSGLIYPSIPPIGGSDLFPGPGAGIYPHRSGGGMGGGMLLGPNDPGWGNIGIGGDEGPLFPGEVRGVPPGAVPPGARFDPFGPPGVPGFEPNRFSRGLLYEEKMLEDPTSRVPEGTMASCHQAPQYIKGHRMMFVMGYSGFGCNINAQVQLEPIPIPHFKFDKHGLGIRPHNALPSKSDATSYEREDVSSHSDSDADSQCSLYEDLASTNLFPNLLVLTLSESIPLDKWILSQLGDHKKGFVIQLDTYAYFREETEMCGWLNKKAVNKGTTTSEKFGKKDKQKSHSDKLFDKLVDKQNEESKDEVIYPFKDDHELPQEVDLTLPLDPTWMEDASKMLVEETINVNIGLEEQPRIIKLGASLSAQEQKIFVEILKEYADIFAWTYADMPGLDPELVVHNLIVHPDAKPVKQKLRKMHPKVALLVKEELEKLLAADFIKPIDY